MSVAQPVGWWLREALEAEAAELSPPAAALEPGSRYDVAVVGGGYTGLWTAWWLLETQPGIRVAVLERSSCGGGPSGRNGGFLHGWWDQAPYLVERFGPEAALALLRLVDESVGAIGAWCEATGVDAWYRRAGYLRVSASPAQDGEWWPAVRTLRGLGVDDAYVELTANEARARCNAPVIRGAALMPNAATVQPARLVRGLRRVLLARGATVHEGVDVARVRPGTPNRLATSAGEVRADQVVLALNAWAADWPGFGTSLLAWGSHIVLTEPAPDVLRAVGWTGGEAIADARFTVHYFRTTPDGRVAFGAGVGRAAYGGRVDGRYDRDPRAEARARAALHRFLPGFADVPIADAWGGPIDISPDRLPIIGSRAGGRIHYAHGYSGNGVAPAHLAGRLLAAMVGDPAGELARLPIVNRHHQRFPPEPFRSVGVRLVREALVRSDEAQDDGRRAGMPIRLVAGLPRALGYRLGSPKAPVDGAGGASKR
ncbi:MAG TPA: FAD-binding oxidoreductase [Candidatus Limnocylindria bacterium]